VPFARYVALGDSQTEGLLDPDGRGGYRGWADRLAEHLAATDPHLTYANLAVRGRLVGAIRAEQLDAALALEPDLATVMGGLNDILRPRFDPDAVVGDLAAMLTALRGSGATVVTNTFPAVEELAPMLRRLAPRVRAVNEGIREAARASGSLLVDVAARGVGTDPRHWSPDRIHANPLGHALIAAAFADTLGRSGHADWADPLPAAAPTGRLRRLGTEARWLGGTVTPWLVRRARGRSSGDGISAKRPRLLPVADVFHLVDPAGWPASGLYRPDSLETEGFVHLSFADQVAGSANRHFAGAVELAAVRLDPVALGTDVRVEDTYGSGTAFPHAYGPLPVAAAVDVQPLARDATGAWVVPDPAAVG
jgi:uncharacterized protein (DUF952 family)/lysophospholipase L1-like esterase